MWPQAPARAQRGSSMPASINSVEELAAAMEAEAAAVVEQIAPEDVEVATPGQRAFAEQQEKERARRARALAAALAEAQQQA